MERFQSNLINLNVHGIYYFKLTYVCFLEADIGNGRTESNLLATICNYPNNSTPGVFPYLTELLDNFEVIILLHYQIITI